MTPEIELSVSLCEFDRDDILNYAKEISGHDYRVERLNKPDFAIISEELLKMAETHRKCQNIAFADKLERYSLIFRDISV